jgi:hypothetical protein
MQGRAQSIESRRAVALMPGPRGIPVASLQGVRAAFAIVAPAALIARERTQGR